MPVTEIGDPRLQALFGASDPRDAGARPTIRLFMPCESIETRRSFDSGSSVATMPELTETAMCDYSVG